MPVLITRTVTRMAAAPPLNSAARPARTATPLPRRTAVNDTQISTGTFGTTLHRNAKGGGSPAITLRPPALIGATLPIMTRHMRAARRAAVGAGT